MAAQFVGSRVSIITKSSNRFEGQIESINVEVGELVLIDVKVFGTEDRQVDNFCPAKDSMYKSIVFKATEIADIRVLSNSATPAVSEQSFGGDPAIVSCGDEIQSDCSSPPPVSVAPPARVYGSHSPSTSYHHSSSRPGATGPQTHNGFQLPYSAPIVSDDYDFDRANHHFRKLFDRFTNLSTDASDAIDNENTAPSSSPIVHTTSAAYDKTKSFFDKVSCKDTEDTPDKRMLRRREVMINRETFGAAPSHQPNFGHSLNYGCNDYPRSSAQSGGGFRRGGMGQRHYDHHDDRSTGFNRSISPRGGDGSGGGNGVQHRY